MYETDEDELEIIEDSSELSVMLETDKRDNPYYPGEEGTVFYTVTRRGKDVTDEVNVEYKLESKERLLARGFAEDGEIEFNVPEDYNPEAEEELVMGVKATLNREVKGFDDIDITVLAGKILLNPSSWEYEANDNISFEYEFQGITMSEIESLEYRVLDDYDSWWANPEVIISGTPSDGVFEITIPEEPEDFYSVQLQAVTESGASIETNERIYRISGYFLRTEIVTDSDYTTGVYEPGDEIEISYELVSRDGSPLPETIRVGYVIQNYPGTHHAFRTNRTEGTFSLTVPELNDGEQVVSINVGEEGNLEIIEVDNDPSLLNRRVMGSVNLGGLLMVILFAITLAIGLLALYRTRSGTTRLREPPRETQQMERREMPAEQEEEFYIEEGESEPEDQWSGVEEEEEIIEEKEEPMEDESQID